MNEIIFAFEANAVIHGTKAIESIPARIASGGDPYDMDS